MRRLLRLANVLCGSQATASVFDPLVADWQRELTESRQRGRWAHARAAASGAGAFTRSLVRCAMARSGWLPTWRAGGIGILAFVAAIVLAMAGVALIAVQHGRPIEPGLRTYSWLLGTAALYVPPALLPAMFLLRRDPRATARHAAAAIALGSALTVGVLLITSPEALNRYFSSFEWSEREYQRGLANDQAGRYQYPGTAYRQLVTPKTVEERREKYARFMVWLEEQRATDAPPTWQERIARMQPVVLAILFGIMGWTLAGMGSPSIPRALVWWVLMYKATLAFGGLLTFGVGEMSFWNARIQFWMAIPVIAAITGSLILASRRLAPQAPQAS
jgi:hypothetical protein